MALSPSKEGRPLVLSDKNQAMKKSTALLSKLFMVVLLMSPLSCGKGEGPDPKIDNPNVFFNFSLSGHRENGVFAVEADPSDLKSVQHIVISTPSIKTGSINVLDPAKDSHAGFKFPVKKGLFELLEANSDNFVLTLHVNDRLFVSKSVSVHITDLVENQTNPMQLSLIKGKFEGVMKHSFTEDRVDKEESYTVHGEFQYLSPSYKRQLK